MKALFCFILLSLTSVASAAEVGPCSTVSARFDIAETLRLATEDRPVNILFRTRADGVKMPAYLIEKYPEEMSIVLQYQFGQLHVKDDRFEVVVWFKGYPARLTVPFNAIKAFHDRDVPKCYGD